MGKVIQINLIHHYKEYGDVSLEQKDIKMSYAIVGENGLYEYGRISKNYYFDYSAPFTVDTKLTNASNVEVVKGIIRDELNHSADTSNYEDSWVEFVDEIEHANKSRDL